MDFNSIPETCRSHTKDPKIPQFLQDFHAAKAKEMYDVIQTLFKNRGATKACGYCSRKIQCRQREEGGHKHMKFGCKHKDFKMVDEECDGHDACLLTPVLGGCPAPTPQKHMQHMQHSKHGHHGHHMFQHGQFHHYEQHWGHHGHFGWHSGEHGGMHSGSHSGSHSGEWKKHSGSHSGSHEWQHRGPRAIDSDSKSNETSTSSKEDSKSESGSNESGSHSGSHESGSQEGHHGNHTMSHHVGLPLWHCVKNKDGSKCLCCCGHYFPDINTGKCQKVKYGDKMKAFDLWELTGGAGAPK
jgi:hypothetical protein